MATTVGSETVALHHQVSSENHRLQTFAELVKFPWATRRQLALAGFIYRQSKCVCVRCDVTISIQELDENVDYAANHFRKLHREKVSTEKKRCAFLLCRLDTNIDDLRPAIGPQPQWDDAEHPEFSNYNTRFETFKAWSHLDELNRIPNSNVTPSTMAKHGFFFSGPRDGVTCFYCGNTLTDWLEALHLTYKEIVTLEHARFFPCRFIHYTTSVKFIADATHSHPVPDQERQKRNPMTFIIRTSAASDLRKPRSLDECLSTFEQWPEEAPVSANNLAAAGFYYLGDQLKVKCYACDLEIDTWKYGMTAMGIHRQRSHDCQFLQALDSCKSGDVQSVDEQWRLHTFDDFPFERIDSLKNHSKEQIEKLCRELAACGFYRYKSTHNIRCAYCDVIIDPKFNCSIMFQHRVLTKQLPHRGSTIDCPMVRAQCPTNLVIPDRARYPEYPNYQVISDRRQSFEDYRQRYHVDQKFINDRANAGFFLETMKRMRCFQCGNSLSIQSKRLQSKYPRYDVEKLHAHFYPTCEWVQEILGSKYVAQVLFDRKRSEQLEREHALAMETSYGTSPVSPVFLPVTSTASDGISSWSNKGIDDCCLSDYHDESDDDEGYEPVATPFQAGFSGIPSPFPSPPLQTVHSHESPLTEAAQPCVGATNHSDQGSHRSPSLNMANPFETISTQLISPPMDMALAAAAPVDLCAFFAAELNRLESFKARGRTTFAQVLVEELAYVGFHFNSEDQTIACSCCNIRLTEARFEGILHRRPIIPDSPLNDEPWTAMRVHRHEIGQYTGPLRSWCPWVRREAAGLYTNVPLPESGLLYPEYPSYSNVEKRIQSFQSNWPYRSGSRLSNAAMAEAGFIHLGDDKVCCFYCGNRLRDFEPRDCPFEEHSLLHPLCDYIIRKLGLADSQRRLSQTEPGSLVKQTSVIQNGQVIKIIRFPPTPSTQKKNERPPAARTNSAPAPSSCFSPIAHAPRSFSTTTDVFEATEDLCSLCCANVAVCHYHPCQHFPMCQVCSDQLVGEQRGKCLVCQTKADICPRKMIGSP